MADQQTPYTSTIDPDVLAKLGIFTGTAADEAVKDELGKADFLTLETNKLPEVIAHVYMMSLKDICKLISSVFKPIFHDYTGCAFYAGPNGFLQLGFVFVPSNAPLRDPDKEIKNIVQLYKKEDRSSLFMTMATCGGRRTLDLTDETKRAMRRYMVVPMDQTINWNDCIDEREVNSANFNQYGTGVFNIVSLRNIDAAKILAQIFTKPDVQRDDYERSFLMQLKKYIKPNYEHEEWKPGAKFDPNMYNLPPGFNREKIEEHMEIDMSYSASIDFKGYRMRSGDQIYYEQRMNIDARGMLDMENCYAVVTVYHNRSFQEVSGLSPSQQTQQLLNCF